MSIVKTYINNHINILLQVGKDLDALEVYRKVYMWNYTEKGVTYEMPEIELPNRPSGFQQNQEPSTILNALENVRNVKMSHVTLLI